ncbi:STAS domain-containing protein [Sphaerisporangium sp. NPDC004334]
MARDLYPPPEVRSWRIGHLWVVRIHGEVDVLTVPDIRRHLDKAVLGPQPPMVAVDLTSVTFMSSAGIGVLVELHHLIAARKGSLTVALPPQGRARRLFELTRLTDLFRVRETLQEAVEELRNAQPAAVHDQSIDLPEQP